jgi:hypothetical protein
LARVIYDNGNEFFSQESQEMLESCGIKAIARTIQNPKAIESANLTMGNMFYSILHGQSVPASTLTLSIYLAILL